MVEFDQKLSILVIIFNFFDQIQLFSIKFDDFWYKIKIRIQIWVRIRIEIVVTIDRTGKFGSKMSIKRRFEYDSDRILAGGRSNRISLPPLPAYGLVNLGYKISCWFILEWIESLKVIHPSSVLSHCVFKAPILHTLSCFSLYYRTCLM